MKKEPKINLMIIGAQKAGTTSLFKYLCEHPDIEGHLTQEFSFFISDEEYKKGIISAYKKYFKKFNNKKLIAKNAGLYVSEKGLKRLKEHNPNCKLIFIIREPVARTISSYKMEVNSGWLKQDFSKLPSEIEKHNQGEYSLMYKLFIKQSLYYENLKLIYKYFDKKNVKVIKFYDVMSNPKNICKIIFRYINVNDNFEPNTNIIYNEYLPVKSQRLESFLHKLKNENNIIKKIIKSIIPYKLYYTVAKKINLLNRSKKEKNNDIIIDKKTVDYLKRFYKMPNNQLTEMLKIDLSDWNI